MNGDSVTWSAHTDNLQVDCTVLEELFLGNTILSNDVTAEKWDNMLSQRLNLLGGSSQESNGKIPVP